MKIRNTVRITITAIVISIVLLNVFWLLYRECRYRPFVENIPKQHDTYITSADGYTYSVNKPRYLKFNGNLALINNESNLTLIVWPVFPTGYKYAVMLEHYTVEIDSEANPVNPSDKINDSVVSELSKNKEAIEELFYAANNMWNLF